jgi:hypothetical protein
MHEEKTVFVFVCHNITLQPLVVSGTLKQEQEQELETNSLWMLLLLLFEFGLGTGEGVWKDVREVCQPIVLSSEDAMVHMMNWEPESEMVNTESGIPSSANAKVLLVYHFLQFLQAKSLVVDDVFHWIVVFLRRMPPQKKVHYSPKWTFVQNAVIVVSQNERHFLFFFHSNKNQWSLFLSFSPSAWNREVKKLTGKSTFFLVLKNLLQITCCSC